MRVDESGASLVDDERFERVWRFYGATVLRYCRFAAGSHEAGEDVAADTFTAFLERGERVGDENVEAWLFTVARNECRSRHRRSALWDHLLPRLLQPSAVGPESVTPTELAALLEPLTAEERLAVYLRVVEGRPFADVAKVLHKSQDATKKTVYRALGRLRRTLGPAAPTLLNRGGVEHE